MTNDEYFTMTYDFCLFDETGHLCKGDSLLLDKCPFQSQGFFSHDGTVALEEISVSGGW